MAHMEKSRRYTDSPKTPRTSPTLEQNFRAEDSHFSGAMSPTMGKHHDQEEFTSPTSGKKSVLKIVKEKAKKLRYSLSGKKKHFQESSLISDGSSHGDSTPSWGVALEDEKLDEIDDHDDPNEQFEDPEYTGAPMYESEAAPEVCKETAKQHPRHVHLEHVVTEKHVLPNTEGMKDDPIQKNVRGTEKHEPNSSNKTVTQTYKSEPVASNKTATEADKPEPVASNKTVKETGAQETAKAPSQTRDEATETARSATQIDVSPHGSKANKEMNENLGNVKQTTSSISPKEWDKGISVKEYFMNALDSKDDEQSLSEAITDATSPKKTTSGSPGVVEKVRGAVTSFFWHEESPNSTGNDHGSNPTSPAAPSLSNKNLSVKSPTYLPRARSTELPRSATINSRRTTFAATPIVHEAVEEENHGKILQTN